MPGATTTNYGWLKPTVGGDADTWGTELNTTLDNIDSSLKTVSDTIPTDDTPMWPVLLKSGNVDKAAIFLTLDMSGWSIYSRIEVKLNKVNPGVASTGVAVQFSTDKGSTFITTGYAWTLATMGASYAGSSSGSATEALIQNQQALVHGTLDITLGATAVMGSWIAGGASNPTVWVGGSGNQTTGINGLKIYTKSGTVLSGTYDVIGYL